MTARAVIAAAQVAASLWLALSGVPGNAVTFAMVILIFSAMLTALPIPAAIRTHVFAAPPENVHLHLAGGEKVPCGVLREPALDTPGHAAWLVVPHADVGDRLDDGYTVHGTWPPGAIIAIARGTIHLT